MRGVDESLEYLHVIARIYCVGIDSVARGDVKPLMPRESRLKIRRAKIRPDQSTGFLDRVGLGTETGFECWVGNVRCFHHGSIDRELPAMKEASDAVTFAASYNERCLSMATSLVEDADGAVGVSECDEFVGQDLEWKGVAVRLGQVRRLQDRYPVSTQSFAHGRLRTDFTNQLVVLLGQHRALPVVIVRSMLSVIFRVR